ncbi:MAG: hypothetical protein ABSC94_32585 [Polyangiaceae bacterium]
MAVNQSTKIDVSDLANIEHLLDEVPAHRHTAVSKQRAIDILAPKLYAMRAKGYSWKDIAGWLMDHGLAVSPVALGGYLRRVRGAGTHDRSKGGRKRRPRMREDRTARSPAAAAPQTVSTAHASLDGGAATKPVQGAMDRRNEPGARRSEFVVRPDTKDI